MVLSEISGNVKCRDGTDLQKKLKEGNKYYRLFMIIGKEQSKVVG